MHSERVAGESTGKIGKLQGTASGLLTLIFGIGLISAAVPRFIAELLLAPSNQYLAALQAGSPVSTEDLQRLESSRQRALRWFPSGRLYLELALAEIQMASRDDVHAAEYLQSARRNIVLGLAREPADPYGWTQLATISGLSQGPSEKIVSMLRMAFATAPFDPKLLQVRVAIALAMWPALDRGLQETTLEQIRVIWRTSSPISGAERSVDRKIKLEQRRQLAATASALGRVSVLREALNGEPTSKELEAVLEMVTEKGH